MKTFFTADLHFGCENLRKHTRAEYRTVEDHDEAILHNLNSVVMRRDRLVVLGDFCFTKPGRYRPRIKCRNIFFILGNHDKETQIKAVFGGNVWQTKMVKLDRGRVWCSHYPTAFWPSSHYGVPSVYGHIHDNQDYENAMDIGLPGRRSMDVGLESAKRLLGEHRPFLSDEVLDLLKDAPGHEELWRDIPGYEEVYQVSTHGNVRSLDRNIVHPRAGIQRRHGQWMQASTDSYGYKVITLCKSGVRKTHKVHRLVLLAFKGPSEMQALHGTGGKANNSLPNLSYGTHEENWEDRRRDGTDLCKPVRRSDGKEYPSQTAAAKDCDCLSGAISNVCYGKSNVAGGWGWSFVTQ